MYFFSDDGGLFGSKGNERKFGRWQVSSPEVAKVLQESEYVTVMKRNEHTEFHHHERLDSFQKKFDPNVKKLVAEKSCTNLEPKI